mgnify:CR=1 FL=1
MFNDYLKQNQPIVERILSNALNQKHAPHAYLFVGPKGTKMLESAKWTIKNQMCPHAHPYACEECDVCRRIEEETFSDLIMIDGSHTSIKKEDIIKLQDQFSKTALEKTGKKFYILNEVDNASASALNSLLKFLEEPSGDSTYAILISHHPERLLETIVSRCQMLTFKPLNRQELLNDIEAFDMDKYELNLLSQLVSDKDEMLSLVSDEETRHNIALFGSFIDEYSRSIPLGELFVQSHILKKKSSPENERARLTLFLNIGMMFFKDVLFHFEPNSTTWKQRMEQLPQSLDTLKAFTLFNDSVHKITSNANLALVIDALIYQLKEDKA